MDPKQKAAALRLRTQPKSKLTKIDLVVSVPGTDALHIYADERFSDCCQDQKHGIHCLCLFANIFTRCCRPQRTMNQLDSQNSIRCKAICVNMLSEHVSSGNKSLPRATIPRLIDRTKSTPPGRIRLSYTRTMTALLSRRDQPQMTVSRFESRIRGIVTHVRTLSPQQGCV